MKTYLTPEQMLPKEGDLVTIQALVGSLIVSPLVSKEENIKIFYVPGAFELSFASMQLCLREDVDAVIAIGCVIRGETPHFDYVCSAVAEGIKDCNVQTDVPAIFCVLTDDSKEQSVARSGGVLGNKGIEAGVTALKMIDFKRKLKDWT